MGFNGISGLGAGLVQTAHLADDAVTAAKVKDGDLTKDHLAAAAGITGAQLAAAAGITGAQLAAAAGITGAQLAAAAGLTGAQLAAAAGILRAQLGESGQCDAGAAGSGSGTATGDVTLLDYTWPSDARYMLVDFLSTWYYGSSGSFAIIDIVNGTITGSYQGCRHDNNSGGYKTVGTLSAVAISVPHSLCICLTNNVLLKVTTWNTGARNIVLKTNGTASEWTAGLRVRAIR